VAKRLALKNDCQRTDLFLNAFHLNLLKAKPMKLKSILLGAAIVVATATAQAGTLGVSLNQTAGGFWSADYDSDFIVGSVLGGAPFVVGTDTITFQDFLMPLVPGMYDVELTFHELANATSTNDPINVMSVNLNGLPLAFQTKRTFTIDGTTKPPFILTVTGSSNVANVGYHGTISVTAVPEPETYALLLAGLGLMGAVARRRKAKQG
jgi:hypothetical protein